MGVKPYSNSVKPKPPDRFFNFGEMHKVLGYGAEPGKPGTAAPYILEGRGWIEGGRYALVVRNGEVVEEGPASQIKPSNGDLIIAAKGDASRLLVTKTAGAFRIPEVGDIDCSRFPTDGALVRGANGETKEVFMGEAAFSEYARFVLSVLGI